MNFQKYLFILSFVFSLTLFNVRSQTTGHAENFSSGNTNGWFGNAAHFTLNNTNNELEVQATSVGPAYDIFGYNNLLVDLTSDQLLTVKLRASQAVDIRIDLNDTANRTTNGNPIVISLPGGGQMVEYTFNFAGRFQQTWPINQTVDASVIDGIFFYLNPGGPAFTGTVFLDDLKIGSAATNITATSGDLFFNQVGYVVDQTKLAFMTATLDSTFTLHDASSGNVVFSGSLGNVSVWEHSADSYKEIDFSSFTNTGSYYIKVGNDSTAAFTIEQKPYENALQDAMRMYYFQRASMPISSQHGGQWARAEGHPDNNVLIHASAAGPVKQTGASISSPGGWYDAGDFGKYIVNSGISMHTLLATYEYYSSTVSNYNNNIPESSDNVPDLLNEIVYNLRWMLSMQDTDDGGVYHKLTTLGFSGQNMPSQANATRYVFQKSITATLDFAAVMAMAARIYDDYSTEFPLLADSCRNAALDAYIWAKANPNTFYNQNTLNQNYDPDVFTGTYGDSDASDEWVWAAAEMYITFQEDSFYNDFDINYGFGIPSWQGVATLSLISLNANLSNLTPRADTSLIKSRLLGIANGYENYYQTSAIASAMGYRNWNFVWGSNGVAGNIGMVLLAADRIVPGTYFDAALSIADYLLGKNPTGYSFLTGNGVETPMIPHHRQSQADGLVDPVPGMLVGGPNPGQQDNCTGYPSNERGLSYLDAWCSYSTNEITINWNAPLVFLLSGIEEKTYTIPLSNEQKIEEEIKSSKGYLDIFPNPVKEELNLRLKLPNHQEANNFKIYNKEGKIVKSGRLFNSEIHLIKTAGINEGVYFLQVVTDNQNSFTKTFLKN